MYRLTIGEAKAKFGSRLSSSYREKLEQIAVYKQGQGTVCMDFFQRVSSVYGGYGPTACQYGYANETAVAQDNSHWCIKPGPNAGAIIGTKSDYNDVAKNLGALFQMLQGGAGSVSEQNNVNPTQLPESELASRSQQKQSPFLNSLGEADAIADLELKCSPTMSLKPYSEVKKHCDELVKISPKRSESYYRRANALSQFSSSSQDAICEDLSIAISLKPEKRIHEDIIRLNSMKKCNTLSTSFGASKESRDLCMRKLADMSIKADLTFAQKAEAFRRCQLLN